MMDMGRAPRWAVAAAAVVVVACHPVERHVHYIGPETGFMKVNARLDCPETSGDLTRSGVAADGASCTYTGPKDETVSLQLTPLAGAAPQAILAKLETQLKSDSGLADLAPPAPQPPQPPGVKGKDWDAGDQAKGDDDRDDDDDEDKSKAASHDTGSKDDHTKIDLPGLHISTNGDKADVSLPGISIHANGDNAEVHAGLWGRSATIDSHDGVSTIRAGRADQSGVDSMLIVSSDSSSPTGYRSFGYVAKGPPAGPLVIATFKAKGDHHSGHDLAGDGLKKLVQLNVHQGFGWLVDADKDAKP
jgi:hypothetical protein